MSWLEYNVNHDLKWLLQMIKSLRDDMKIELEKEEDEFGLSAFRIKGFISALDHVEELITQGMMEGESE